MVTSMAKLPVLLLMSVLWHSPINVPNSVGVFSQEIAPKIEVVYDRSKNKTTVSLGPVRISGEKGKYHSLHMAPSFDYQGQEPRPPEIIDFELQTVVRGRLRTDLYVVFVIDGETVFLSSNRWAVKRPVPGRVWVGERLVFRMPYETFLKITKARAFAIKFDGVEFSVGEAQKQTLTELLSYMKPAINRGA